MSINSYVMGYKQSTILRHCAAPTLQHCYKKHVNPFFCCCQIYIPVYCFSK